MDGLMTAIISGVVVAVIGAIVAFYFGRVQERQKQSYEEQRNEQERRENKQQEENERRATVFAEITHQAHSVVRDYESLTADTKSLIEFLERDYKYNYYTYPEVEIQYRKLLANYYQTAIAISDKAESFWGYYKTEKTFLEPESRTALASLFKATNAQIEREEARLRAQDPEGVSTESEEPSQLALALQEMQDEIRNYEERAAERREVVPYNIQKVIVARREKQYATSMWRTRREEVLPALKAGLEDIRRVDFPTHLAALDDESERLARRARNS
jgi:hypothetical protein